MTSYYSQIQYVPDPLTGERVNVGVVAVDSNGCTFRFVRDWRRAASFGGEDVSFLKEFADEANSKGASWFAVDHDGSVDTLSKSIRRWHNKIQFSELLPSVKGHQQLIEEIAQRVLHEAPAPVAEAMRHSGRGRDKVISSAAKSLGNAMRERFGKAPRGLIQRQVDLEGKIESYKLDVALKNGTLYGGAFAVSFETGSPRSQERDTESIAWAVEDIMQKQSDVNIAVVVLPPPQSTPTYVRARHIFKEINAPIVRERELDKWAVTLVETLPADIAEAA